MLIRRGTTLFGELYLPSVWHSSQSGAALTLLACFSVRSSSIAYADRIWPIPVLRAFRKYVPEHGQPAFRLLFGRFILNDVPMLDKDSVLNAHNVCGNPIHRSTETAKSPMHNFKNPSAFGGPGG
jgi:hypothetical protein